MYSLNWSLYIAWMRDTPEGIQAKLNVRVSS